MCYCWLQVIATNLFQILQIFYSEVNIYSTENSPGTVTKLNEE